MIYIEGMDANANAYLFNKNPDDNPYDMLVMSIVRGGNVKLKSYVYLLYIVRCKRNWTNIRGY